MRRTEEYYRKCGRIDLGVVILQTYLHTFRLTKCFLHDDTAQTVSHEDDGARDRLGVCVSSLSFQLIQEVAPLSKDMALIRRPFEKVANLRVVSICYNAGIGEAYWKKTFSPEH